MLKVEEFRSIFEEALTDIAARTKASYRCIILSGGVDTCAVLAAAHKLGVTFEAAITVITGEESPDKNFSVACAEEHGIPHHLMRLTADDLVAEYLPKCIEILHVFNGMTLRNSLVIAAAMRKALELGMKHAVVGDGADELFGGYSFMWGNAEDPAQWKEKRDSMCAKWKFATEALADAYGLDVHSPFTEPKTVKFAIEKTERIDCIGTRPIRLVHKGDTTDHETGKIILREAYDTVASWRRKDPIEKGSGVTVIGHDPYWADIISDGDFKLEQQAMLSRGYVIRSKENLFNFRAFEERFGKDGSWLDDKKRLPLGEGCVDCCFEIGDSTYCQMCGAWPAQRSTISASG